MLNTPCFSHFASKIINNFLIILQNRKQTCGKSFNRVTTEAADGMKMKSGKEALSLSYKTFYLL